MALDLKEVLIKPTEEGTIEIDARMKEEGAPINLMELRIVLESAYQAVIQMQSQQSRIVRPGTVPPLGLMKKN